MTTPDVLEVRFERELRDVLAAAQLYQSGTTKHRVYQIVALILVVFATYQGLSLGFGGNQLLLIVIGLLLALDPIPLILTVMSSFGIPDRCYTLRVTEQGIELSNSSRTATFAWNRFNSLVENQRYLLLVYGSWNYIAIPQRAFSKEQRALFDTMLTKQVQIKA
jgi:hypothetical protein